jgi:hypothetical protein
VGVPRIAKVLDVSAKTIREVLADHAVELRERRKGGSNAANTRPRRSGVPVPHETPRALRKPPGGDARATRAFGLTIGELLQPF